MLKVMRVDVMEGKVQGLKPEMLAPLTPIELSLDEIEFVEGLVSLQETEVEACLREMHEAI